MTVINERGLIKFNYYRSVTFHLCYFDILGRTVPDLSVAGCSQYKMLHACMASEAMLISADKLFATDCVAHDL